MWREDEINSHYHSSQLYTVTSERSEDIHIYCMTGYIYGHPYIGVCIYNDDDTNDNANDIHSYS